MVAVYIFNQGLYKGDERFGPGVYTYVDGCQDVGMWHRERIIRLCSESSEGFFMADHSDFEYDPEAHRMFIYPEYLHVSTLLSYYMYSLSFAE